MTNRAVVAVVLLVLAAVGTLGTPVGAAAGPDAPIAVNHSYVGGDAGSDHAYHVTVTVAPSREDGAINDTLLTVEAGEVAFIDSESIATSQTTGGSQVITQVADSPAKFRFGQIEPGETASISFRLYPQATLPAGETLATVDVETQFVQTQRVVTDTLTVAPTLQSDRAQFATEPPVPPLVSGGMGAAVAAVVLGVGVTLWRRRLYRTLRRSLRSAKKQTVSTEAEREVDAAIRRVGGGANRTENPEPGDDGGAVEEDFGGLDMEFED